jgi:hypothetical protein
MTQSTPTRGPLHIDEGVFGKCVIGIWRPNGLSARIALAVACAANCAIFWHGSRWFAVPMFPKLDGSLFLQASPATAIGVVAVLLAVTTLVGTILAGAVRFEAGLFAAALGLAVVSLRSGTMQSVLFEAGGNSAVYVILAAELAGLLVLMCAMWTLLWLLGRARLVRPPVSKDASDVPAEHVDDLAPISNVGATLTQVVATAILIMFFCQTEMKDQVLTSVAVASLGGTFVSYMCFPTRPSVWYWVGPVLVGLIGYGLAASGQDAQLGIGMPVGFFAALARPLPLDYASVGTAGAILGYWLARRKDSATSL